MSKVAIPVKEGTLRVQLPTRRPAFEVTTDGGGVVGQAGAALMRELADWLQLTDTLAWRQPGGARRHPHTHVLRNLVVLLADDGACLSDLAVLRDQPELFGEVASTATAWRLVGRAAHDPDGPARLCGPRARPRRAWAAGAWPRRHRGPDRLG